VGVAGAKESNQANDDQIYGDDEVQQPRRDKNQNSCDQRHEGSETQVDSHESTFSFQSFFDSAAKAITQAPPPTSNQPMMGGSDTVWVRSAVAVIGPIWRMFSVVV
jgi:hypothetical protein